MPQGLRKIKFSFEADGFTRFGGIVLFQQFCKNLGLRYFLQHYVKWPIIPSKIYHPADLFLTHLYAVVAGIERIQNIRTLIHNGLLPSLLGLARIPHHDTLRDLLAKITPDSFQNLQRAHDKIRTHFFGNIVSRYSSVVDMDTTVLTVYGQQQNSAVGYNPSHRGKKSFCPILASEGNINLTLNFTLRPGNMHPSLGTTEFLRHALTKLPSTVANTRTRIRADSSFYDQEILDYLDEYRIGYVIVAKITGPLKNLLPGIRYHPFRPHWDCGEFRYQPHSWKTKRRFIAIRNLKTESDPTSTLFAIKEYSYRILVTNLSLQPEAVRRFYCHRANQELLIRELKNNFALAKIPTRLFLANQVFLEMVLWAYDLMAMFKYSCLPKQYQNWNMATIRKNLIHLPAELVRPHNYNLLRLPAQFAYRDVFQHVQRAVAKIKPIV
jgi:hypothetical protein